MEQLQNRLRMKYFARLATLFSCLFITIALTAQNDSVAPQAVTRTQDMIDYEKVLDKGMENMLNEYYVKRERANSTSVLSSYSDEEQIAETEGVDMDSVYEARVHRMNRIVQLGYGPAVRNYIELYVNKRKRSSSAILGLAQHYYPMMKEVFDKYDLPEELVYLTIIESSLNPTAVSPAGATGIWQFMYTTGKTYGLKANSFVDDRRDPYKATDAAARHLRDLYGIFNDWGLAISAYNCGAGNVRKAIARSGGKNTFWEIRNYLPKETQNYFPAYIGAFYMMKYYKVHGIKPANISIPTDVDTIIVKKEVHFEQIAHVLGIDEKEIEALNPQYKRKVIPAFEGGNYALRLRSKDIIRFMSLEDSIYRYDYDTYFQPLQMYVSAFTGKPASGTQGTKKYHTVKSGETLAKVATKYGISVEELKKMNGMKSNYVKTGQKLVVGYESKAPASTATDKTDKTDTEASSSSASSTSTSSSPSCIIHTVKKGETLIYIANKYHTSYQKIAKDNGIKNINSLVVGQKLKINK